MNQLHYNNTGAFRAPRMRETYSLNQRTFGLVFAALIEAAVVYLLLAQLGVVPMPRTPHPLSVFNVALPKPNEDPPALPFRPVEMPQIPQMVIPEITLEYTPPQEAVITPPEPPDRQAFLPPPPAITWTPARALIATHTARDYPPTSRRLGEQGSLRLRLTVASNGTISDAVVEKSSGFSRLDDAAVQWVKGHWRYQPAMRGTQAVASTTSAVVTFELH